MDLERRKYKLEMDRRNGRNYVIINFKMPHTCIQDNLRESIPQMGFPFSNMSEASWKDKNKQQKTSSVVCFSTQTRSAAWYPLTSYSLPACQEILNNQEHMWDSTQIPITARKPLEPSWHGTYPPCQEPSSFWSGMLLYLGQICELKHSYTPQPAQEVCSNQTWRRDWRKGSPLTGPTLDSSQGRTPRPDTITDIMVCLQIGT